MATDEEKTRIGKLLKDLETPEVKLTERCHDLVRHFHHQFDKEVEKEEIADMNDDLSENPYRVQKGLLEETERKLKCLLAEGKRARKEYTDSLKVNSADPKRPWRTNSSKEKLHRIDSELKRHHEKASEKITPLPELEMRRLVKECHDEGRDSSPPSAVTVRDVVEEAKKDLPNFQYRQIENSTAKAILADAHSLKEDQFNDSGRSGSGDELLKI